MRKLLKSMTLAVALVVCGTAVAQDTKWFNPLDVPAGKTFVHNQAWNEDGGNYARLPLRAKDKVREPLWNLSRNSAGITLRFKTDAKDINVKYTVAGGMSMPHMPATGVSGVDLYRDSDKGFCFGSYSFGDTVRYSYTVDRGVRPGAMEEFTLYLPLYNTVNEMWVGVPEGARFEFVEPAAEKPLVLYGTSIAQGACASRPAMAWGNILSRNLGMPLVNLGFSGNGRLEPELIDLINEIDAQAIMLDCMPNLIGRSSEEIESLVTEAVKQIRKVHPDVPVVLIEHAGYSNAPTNEVKFYEYDHSNKAQRKAYEALKASGVNNLHYIERADLGVLPEGIVDYVHPSDLGMMRQATAVERHLRKILGK